jgi:hypothetical protein
MADFDDVDEVLRLEKRRPLSISTTYAVVFVVISTLFS